MREDWTQGCDQGTAEEAGHGKELYTRLMAGHDVGLDTGLHNMSNLEGICPILIRCSQ